MMTANRAKRETLESEHNLLSNSACHYRCIRENLIIDRLAGTLLPGKPCANPTAPNRISRNMKTAIQFTTHSGRSSICSQPPRRQVTATGLLERTTSRSSNHNKGLQAQPFNRRFSESGMRYAESPMLMNTLHTFGFRQLVSFQLRGDNAGSLTSCREINKA
jgi:hypothetical protein